MVTSYFTMVATNFGAIGRVLSMELIIEFTRTLANLTTEQLITIVALTGYSVLALAIHKGR